MTSEVIYTTDKKRFTESANDIAITYAKVLDKKNSESFIYYSLNELLAVLDFELRKNRINYNNVKKFKEMDAVRNAIEKYKKGLKSAHDSTGGIADSSIVDESLG